MEFDYKSAILRLLLSGGPGLMGFSISAEAEQRQQREVEYSALIGYQPEFGMTADS